VRTSTTDEAGAQINRRRGDVGALHNRTFTVACQVLFTIYRLFSAKTDHRFSKRSL